LHPFDSFVDAYSRSITLGRFSILSPAYNTPVIGDTRYGLLYDYKAYGDPGAIEQTDIGFMMQGSKYDFMITYGINPERYVGENTKIDAQFGVNVNELIDVNFPLRAYTGYALVNGDDFDSGSVLYFGLDTSFNIFGKGSPGRGTHTYVRRYDEIER